MVQGGRFMKLTKYQHACFTAEKDGKLLVVDPGAYTHDLEAPENVVAIIVTHEHPDHFDVNALGALIAHNPEAVVIAHESITTQLGNALPHKAVAAGDQLSLGPFELKFVGGEHAQITPDMPALANLGLLVNNTLYYPGDSFFLPEEQFETLALPAAAPWCKISEVMEFATRAKASTVFPTHDAILSGEGKELIDRMLAPIVGKAGGKYIRVTEPIDI